MIVMRTPKGWTCPKEIDGKREEGYWRSHQVPMSAMRGHPEHVRILENWMKSYRPDELFDASGRLIPELAALPPTGTRRMSANPHANGGSVLHDLRLPDFCDYAVDVPSPGASSAEATRVMGDFLRDVMKLNLEQRNFRLFSPDENNSNRWQDVLEVTNRAWAAETLSYDDHLAPDGRVMEMLERAPVPGLARGLSPDRPARLLLLLRGLHPHHRFHVQPARKMAEGLQRHRVAPSDRFAQLPVVEPCLAAGPQRLLPSGPRLHRPRHEQEGRGRARLSAAGRELPALGHRPLPEEPQLRERRRRRQATVAAMADHGSGDQALHGGLGHLGMGEQRSRRRAGCRDGLLRRRADARDPRSRRSPAPACARDSRCGSINVVDLMRLQPPSEHPHGLNDRDFDALFTTDKPIIFAFHGYPWLIHRLTYRRHGHDNIHVRGYKEEGTTTTPFDMCVLNDLDRFHLVMRRDRPRARPRRARGLREAGASRQAHGPPRPTCAATATTCLRSRTGPGAAEEVLRARCNLDGRR